jgi:hypothetical protein
MDSMARLPAAGDMRAPVLFAAPISVHAGPLQPRHGSHLPHAGLKLSRW